MFLQAPGRAGEPARLRAMVLTVMNGRSGGNIQALVNLDPVAARSGTRSRGQRGQRSWGRFLEACISRIRSGHVDLI